MHLNRSNVLGNLMQMAKLLIALYFSCLALPGLAEENARHTSPSLSEQNHPIDLRETLRYIERYSRGNDDANENRGGMYETAKMDFVVVVSRDDKSVELWLELIATLSTSEIKGATTGADYGARESLRQLTTSFTQAEQQARLEKDLQEKKQSLESALERFKKEIADLDSESPDYESRLEELQAEEAAVSKRLKGDLKSGIPLYVAHSKLLNARNEFVPFHFLVS